ncbi:MAG: SPOR domain-containing protein [Candidatus Omnitrophica bacterium]|nr:SPOR domain-containing protein [Candidatus Omnitrophota bacterium]
MADIQKEFFDQFGEKGKKRSSFFQTQDPREHISFSFDALLLTILLLVMCVVIIYATGVEIGRQAKSPLSRRTEDRPIAKTVEKPVKKFTIQVASYQEKKVAEREVERLRKQGVEAFLITSGKSVALCIGAFETRGSADRAVAELQKRYKDCFVRNR